MTRCEFFTENDRITGFSISGHSGYAEAGSDIVCAAISAVVTMAEATINDVCGAKAKVRVKDEQARITLTLPASCDEEETVQAVLDGENSKVGTPVVEGACVEAKVVKNGKGKKIHVLRYKAKKGEKKKIGHRQPYTKVEITKIAL